MAAAALLQHYIEYLTTPTVLLTILVLVGPILYTVGMERSIASKTVKPSRSPGCRRLGLVGPSNLSTQHDQPPLTDGIPRVKALFTYPIKSCRGVELSATEVEATGLKFDRLMTFAQLVSKPAKKADKDQGGASVPSEQWQHQWRFITQREFPRLALLRTELWVPDPRGRTATANGHGGKDLKVPASKPRTRSRTRGSTLVGQLEQGGKAAGSGDWTAEGGCLVVRFPFEPDFNPLGLRTQEVKLVLPLIPSIERAKAKQYTTEDLSIWKDNPQALNLTCEIDKVALEKLRYFLGVSNPLALFRVDPNKPRAVTRCLPADKPGEEFKVGFADAFPVNILGLASVRKTDAELPATAEVKGKLDSRRFRANIYIEGVEAFAEDEWKKIIVGTRVGRDKDGLFECDAEYHVACRTARCTLPNVHPDTGIKDKNEPYTTLGKTRKVDKGALPHPCLGVHTIPLFASGILRVGDEIEVLEKGEHVYEKMFNSLRSVASLSSCIASAQSFTCLTLAPAAEIKALHPLICINTATSTNIDDRPGPPSTITPPQNRRVFAVTITLASTMDKSPLRRLPAELRNVIYELVLVTDADELGYNNITLFASTDGRIPANCKYERKDVHIAAIATDKCRTRTALSMTLTCREIRTETLPMFLHLNSFVLQHATGKMGIWSLQREQVYTNTLKVFCKWLKLFPASAVNALTLHISFLGGNIHELGKRPTLWWNGCRRVEKNILHQFVQPSNIRHKMVLQILDFNAMMLHYVALDWAEPSHRHSLHRLRYVVYDLPTASKEESRAAVELA
ncbi:hypothetical protein LTR22_016140 [Elasticomyces elasticus]|nr:hypothetical protein LTR22_016140 [Elasticomyces elasticus]KAK4914401.1 hypothetical protein LTR49_017320 [Elasticomyces elasticus]KAK5760377.1 hypothetical protein LTS12_009420 [Elasticomyces elasticus]